MKNLSENLREKLAAYYYNFYYTQLGLPDHQQRIQWRLNEEERYGKPHIEKIRNVLRYSFDKTKKILVLGGGTGAQFIQFAKMGCDVYTIEPSEKAIEIMRLKCEAHHIAQERVFRGVGEYLPFKNEVFDFIYCFSVIEHVQNVEQTIQEALRVTKSNGYLYILTHDYHYPYEGHYKLYLPLFFPKWIIKRLLIFHKRPTAFLDSLQFVTAKKLRNLFCRNRAVALRVYFPLENRQREQKFWMRLGKWMEKNLGIYKDQIWIAQKMPIPKKNEFSITKSTMKQLREAELPDSIISALKPLKQKKFVRKEELLDAIENKIGKEQMNGVRKRIENIIDGF